MITTLKGKVTYKTPEAIVLDVGGVGYELFLNAATLETAKVGETALFWTYEHLREDSHEIFGFASKTELDLYRKLVSVSGVGPKMALNILGLGTVSAVEAIIERGDIDMISKVHRVGRKTAQKIVLELKGKLVQPEDGGKHSGREDDVTAALVSMGVDRQAAREAAKIAAETEKTVEGRLKAALRQLGR